MREIYEHGESELQTTLAHIRAALFILAALLLALCGIGLASYPPVLHSIPLRLEEQRLQRLSLAGAQTRHLDIAHDGQIVIDGRPLCDLLELRQELDVIANGREAILEVRPDPELRYETLVEIIAITGRANIQNLRVDLRAIARPGPARPRPQDCQGRLVL